MLTLLLASLVANAADLEPPQTVVSVDTTGVLGFATLNVGRMGVIAEHVRGGRHGVTLQAGTIHLHGDPNHLWSFGASAGYRYHLGSATNAPFIGARVALEQGYGRYIWDPTNPDGHAPEANVDLDLRHAALTAHVGYRWNLIGRVDLTYRVGAGLGRTQITAVPSTDTHGDEAVSFAIDRWQRAPIVFDSELSLGVRFGRKP